MKKNCLLVLFFISLLWNVVHGQQIISGTQSNGSFSIADAVIYVDANDFALVKKSAALFQEDVERVTGKKLRLINKLDGSYKTVIAIGSITNSELIKVLLKNKKLNAAGINGKWEAYQIQSVNNYASVQHMLVIAGSDRRGTAYGIFELSKQIGVSPWYWWADVPVRKQPAIYINTKAIWSDAPKVKYRGIFINDEAPALSNWSKEKFGGFHHQFYAKVFELLLRLKANYIWPAMWGNAFYDDDSLNIKTADEYGIVIGTSHHEPLMRAHEEWKRYGNKKVWNYDSTEVGLKEFWRTGMQRATNEKIVSVGMRGDGDAPMSRETATALLERIVKDQRKIIEEVTGKPASETPQLWALYKEVQDYYDKGMRVPDDVTLLLCDDNWGNIRRLPKLNEPKRKGGYGIYYHFDYVGGPRNYKWLNTNPIPRVWEQMHLAYDYNVKNIWIVNVGDIKPMEFPISFFLDYAWNPEKIGADDLQKYTEQWAAAQFGKVHAKEIADIIAKYSKYNGRRKPELLDANTYDIENGEFAAVVDDYKLIETQAEKINQQLSPEYRDAFFQLVLHPVKACANLNELYFYVAKNKWAYQYKIAAANEYADKVKQLYQNDSLISVAYHQLNNGKWNHMMDQTHIGYTYWQQPAKQVMPAVQYITNGDSAAYDTAMMNRIAEHPKNQKRNLFAELNGKVSIAANHFTKAVNASGVSWKVLPDLGKTGSAVTSFPVTVSNSVVNATAPHLEYEFYTYSKDTVSVKGYFSPTLNFNNTETGLRYAVSIDDGIPQVIAINKEDNNVNKWNKWVADNIIVKTSTHTITKPGKHILKYWMLDAGIVLQQFVLCFGAVDETYLGPPETIQNNF